MRSKWLIALLTGLFILALAGSAFAWSGKADIDGKPDQFRPGGAKGFYIWQDEHGFHIWTATHGEGHVFSGVIRTDGQFVRVRGHRLEADDSFKVYSDIQERFWFDARQSGGGNHFAVGGREVDYANDKLRFKFDTAGGSDGLNFRVENASYIDFDLFMDGRPIHPREIYLGDSSWHPQRHTFRLTQ
ncbi:MAG: hypothetical protein P4N41_24575 [Negativicutes bacterium]|nr:hypothetical protein [Negativicutes bacterium]MDR3592847.1 hypothetical protein [Negativicutes bacterium]